MAGECKAYKMLSRTFLQGSSSSFMICFRLFVGSFSVCLFCWCFLFFLSPFNFKGRAIFTLDLFHPTFHSSIFTRMANWHCLRLGVPAAQLVRRRSWRRGQTAGGGSVPRWSTDKPHSNPLKGNGCRQKKRIGTVCAFLQCLGAESCLHSNRL